MIENKEHWVVSHGSASLDHREEIICFDEKEVEGACNLVDQRYSPDTIYVFKRPDDAANQNAYFWKGGSIMCDNKFRNNR